MLDPGVSNKLAAGQDGLAGAQQLDQMRAFISTLTPPQITHLTAVGTQVMASGSTTAGADFDHNKVQITRMITEQTGLPNHLAEALIAGAVATAFLEAKGSPGRQDESTLSQANPPPGRLPGSTLGPVAGANADPTAQPGAQLTAAGIPSATGGGVILGNPHQQGGVIQVGGTDALAVSNPLTAASVPFGTPAPDAAANGTANGLTLSGVVNGLLNRQPGQSGPAVMGPAPAAMPGQVMTVGPNGQLVAAWVISNPSPAPSPTGVESGPAAAPTATLGILQPTGAQPQPQPRPEAVMTPDQVRALVAAALGGPATTPSRPGVATAPGTAPSGELTLSDLRTPTAEGRFERPWSRWTLSA